MTSTGAVHEPPSTQTPATQTPATQTPSTQTPSSEAPLGGPVQPAWDQPVPDCWPDIDRPTSDSPSTATTDELTDVTLRWSDLGLFLCCYALLVAVWFAIGKAVVNSSAITNLDESVADWFVDQRTPDLDTATKWGSGLADTFVKIGVTALLAIAMRVAWKRWREPLMMVVPLVLEAAAFITVTYMIARPRPDDPLETSPVNSSFPSGHVAAAAAYGALVIIVFWHTRTFWIRALVVIVSVLIPVVVGVSRMYRGMHFLSDVIAGAALGIAAVALSWWMIRRAVARTERAVGEVGAK